MDDTGTMAEATHPPASSSRLWGLRKAIGCSCEEHDVCGEVVEEDTLLRLRREQILVDGKEETSIACYWVTDGIDRCRVVFLKCHMVKHAWRFDGALVHVTKVFNVDPHCCDSAERKMCHHNHGCKLGTIVSKICEDRKRKVQEDGGGGSL
jgi:hypothetical protein